MDMQVYYHQNTALMLSKVEMAKLDLALISFNWVYYYDTYTVIKINKTLEISAHLQDATIPSLKIVMSMEIQSPCQQLQQIHQNTWI
jgi:hypothetical protein